MNESIKAPSASDTELFDSIPGLVCTMSPEGEIEVLNRQLREFFGKPAEELKGWVHSDAIHPDDLASVITVHERSMKTGLPYEIENRCRRADGAYRWVRAKVVPVRDSAGRLLRWCSLLTDVDDRRRAEDAIRESERNLTQIVNAIPTLAWSARPDGTAEFFNQHYLDYVGLTFEQAQGWGWTASVHPDDLALLAPTWARIIGSGLPGEAEARLRSAYGEYRWFLFRAHPLFSDGGEIVKWYGTNTDIEERKRAEERVRANERNLGYIINTIPVLAWCNFPDGSNEFLNRPWHDYTGLSPEQAHGWGWQAAIHPDDLPGLLTKWSQLLASGEPGDTEARLRRFDGTYRWFLFRVNPLRDDAGSIVRWYGTNTDIDDRKMAEEELYRKEAFLAEGQRLSATGSFHWKADTDDFAFSEELSRIFGFEHGGTVSFSRITERVHPEDRELFLERMQYARTHPDAAGYSVRLRMPDGAVKYLRAFGRGERLPSGAVEFVGAVQDVTQRRQSEEALGKARSELAHMARVSSLGALTASIAHEVNQPLSGIVTNASACLRMLAADQPNLEAACETARRTIRDANRASDVIKRLRALFANHKPSHDVVDLNAAAQDVIALMAGDLQRERVVLQTEFSDRLPSVAGDRVQLQQVVMNLITNALDAVSTIVDRPRRMSVRTRREDGNRVCLLVEDSGAGIAAEDVERLFQAFYTTKGGGMGIGLFISHSIIESHRGRIWAVPNASAGTTVAFSIPALPEAGNQGTLGHQQDPGTKRLI